MRRANSKPSGVVIRTCHPDRDSQRGGTLAYFAALDVHLGQVLGRCAPKTRIDPFGELVEQVMTTEPYASAHRVYWVVDNGSSHNGARSVQRMSEAFPHATLVHLPVHASWVNQVEVFFSIVQRKSSRLKTSPTYPPWSADCLASRTATTRPPDPSTGATPAKTSTTTSPASPPTKASQHDPRRTNGRDH